jgi:hypothetical protein
MSERREPECVPLCGASKAYGRFDQPWKHEPECPVRQAWEAERAAAGGAEKEGEE